MDLDTYLQSVTDYLLGNGYQIKYDVPFQGQEFKCVAKNGRFRTEMFGYYCDYFFIFSHFDAISFADLRDYSRKCMRYGSRHKLFPILYIPFTFHLVFSAAIVDYVDNGTIEELRFKDRPEHFASYEFPAIYCLQSEQLYYSEENPLWYSRLHNYYRQLACQYLLPTEE